MKSGNSGDINENTARCVSITDIKNECIILYCACVVLHVVMALFYEA